MADFVTGTSALIPVFTGTLSNSTVRLCDARALHAFMQVKRDFATWVKARIKKYGFIAGIDYVEVFPKSGENLGGRPSIDYRLTLDMAKELAMVENNDMGRQARRYFIACEAAVITPVPAAHARITTAQAQHLKELVHLVAESGRQTYGETWERLHRKMKVNSYLELAASQFDEACNYLRGKIDDTSTAALIQKHFPGSALAPAAPALDSDRTASAFMAAQSVTAQVQKSVFTSVLAGGDDWKYGRWLVSFITDSKEAIPAWVDKLNADDLVMSLPRLACAIAELGGLEHSDADLANLAAACNKRLAERLKYQASERAMAVQTAIAV